MDEQLNLLHHSEVAVRRKAARHLNRFSSSEVVTALIDALLNDLAPQVRWTAAWSLAIIGHSRGIKPLITALDDQDFQVRYQTALAIGRFPTPSPEFINPLLISIRNNNIAAAETMLKIGRRVTLPGLTFQHLHEAQELLISGLSRSSCFAACALGRYGDTQVVEALIGLLWDESEHVVRLHAIKGLGRLGDERAIKHLIPFLKNDHLRDVAYHALIELGYDPDIPHQA